MLECQKRPVMPVRMPALPANAYDQQTAYGCLIALAHCTAIDDARTNSGAGSREKVPNGNFLAIQFFYTKSCSALSGMQQKKTILKKLQWLLRYSCLSTTVLVVTALD